MNIAYALFSLDGGADLGGQGSYAWRCLYALIESKAVTSDDQLTILASTNQLEMVGEFAASHPQLDIRVKRLISIKKLSRIFEFFASIVIWADFKFGISVLKRLNYLEWQCALERIDWYHFPCPVPPNVIWRKSMVVTPHDFQDYHYPEFFSSKNRIYRQIRFFSSMTIAEQILVAYKHVGDDIIRLFPDFADKIVLCPHILNTEWVSVQTIESDKLYDIRAKYSLSEDFILYPAQTWQHKNHLGLLHSLSLLKKQRGNLTISLVCTGKTNKFYLEKIEPVVTQLGLDNSVKFLGVVPREDLFELYANCQFVIIPTLYEAGSYPLMEALLLNCPVICSNVTSLPETIGNDVLTFDPTSELEMVNIISKMLFDRDFYNLAQANSKYAVQRLLSENVSALQFYKLLYK